MKSKRTLLECYLPPPGEGFTLESLVMTTYEVNFEFVEEELLPVALETRAPASQAKPFRSELERKLQKTDVTVLYDLAACTRLARLSPRIDAVPIATRKLHSKISLLMWSRLGGGGERRERRIRLIVGSANLTRQGFRENYECVAALDFGGIDTGPRSLLVSAVDFVRKIATGMQSPQLKRQLDRFTAVAERLPAASNSASAPYALVSAEDLLRTMDDAWRRMKGGNPRKFTIVSPFWPEGDPSAMLAKVVKRFGSPQQVELICRGRRSSDGRAWLPEFDGDAARELRKQLPCQLFLRAAKQDYGTSEAGDIEDDAGNETEEGNLARGVPASTVPGTERALHAKMLLIESDKGALLYVGSSNCTRRGLGLGRATNSEAGLIYRFKPQGQQKWRPLLEFAGVPVEVLPDRRPATEEPAARETSVAPAFIEEVVGAGTDLKIRFRLDQTVPADLVLLMEIPASSETRSYWLLYRRGDSKAPRKELSINLAKCSRCNDHLKPVAAAPTEVVPDVQIEVRWGRQVASYPVRFDDKATLPLVLLKRKATEAELIEYFLLGREPGDGGGGEGGDGGNEAGPSSSDDPLDTRRILSYFIRDFVQAIPGIEVEIARASYSPTALAAALRGPTSPLELAERAFASLATPPGEAQPQKTPTAVGFQIVEILAAILRARANIEEPQLKACFLPAIRRCRAMLNTLAAEHGELRTGAFARYRQRLTEANR